ncbi:hypothetical protein EDC04DRAFT_3136207 [Pisolithus marmoratus]|nr:hypothetical protein EDC04DRAFT_3136207 [Pisolithus marmoratus]
MQRGPTYPRPSSNMQVVLDHSSSPLSGAVTHSQQQCGPNRILYNAVPRYCSDGEDTLHQNRTISPLTDGRPMISSEYDQHFRSCLAHPTALLPALGTHGARDYAVHPPNGPQSAEVSMAHTLGQMNPVCNVQGVRIDNHVENRGGSSMVPPFKSSPHVIYFPPIDPVVHANSINFGTPKGHHGYQDVKTFFDSDELPSPASTASSPSCHVPTGPVAAPATPPIVLSVADGSVTNVETVPVHLYRTALQPRGGNHHEGMDRGCQASSEIALLSSPNKSRHQVQLCAVGRPTIPALPTYYVDSPKTTAFFGHQDGSQNTPNYYNVSQPSYPSAGSAIPTRTISPATSDQVNRIPPRYPPRPQGYLGPSNDNATAIVVSGSSRSTLSIASFPLEAFQTDPFPPRSTDFATQEPPQVASQSFGDLRPCRWQDEQGDVCRALVGRNCQDHLRSAHGISNIPSSRLVMCRTCGSQVKRKYFLRHFREVDLGFRRYQ